MSIPAQGAVGAETMTIAAIIEERWTGLIGPAMEGGKIGWKRHELCREFANAVRTALTHPIAAGKLPLVALDFAEAAWGDVWVENEIDTLREFAALASPRADSGERTAGEDAADLIRQVDAILRKPPEPVSHPSEAWCDDYADWHDAYVVARSKVLATPAQPARPLPDSLRALSEARPDLGAPTREPSLREILIDYYQPWFSHQKSVELADRYIAALLASHSAGQSAGSGADLTEPHAVFLAMHAGKIAKPTLDRLVQIYGADTLRTHLARLGPETDLAVTARSRGEWGLKGGHDTEGTSKLLIEIADRLSSAPDSTRTGDEGMEEAIRRRLARFLGKPFDTDESYAAACEELIRDLASLAGCSGTSGALVEALTKINDIRNSIIGLQTLNWSEHVYPLVAALDAAGFEGMDYPEARENFGTMLERTNAAEDALAKALAARPAAPEAQGAWSFDMEAAPRDGTPINVARDNGCGWDLLTVWWSKSDAEYPWHTESGADYPADRFDCWATLPAPPASSGQGGR